MSLGQEYPETAFEALTSGRWESEKLDRDPIIFNHFLIFLEHGYVEASMRTKIEEEIEFWGIPNPLRELTAIFENEPQNISKPAKEKWLELGPLNVERLVEDAFLVLDRKIPVIEQNDFAY